LALRWLNRRSRNTWCDLRSRRRKPGRCFCKITLRRSPLSICALFRRQPELRRQLRELQGGLGMPGGPRNPLGSRALYLWHSNKDTLYRIHGTVQPWTIGTSAESSPWADTSPAIPACRGWSLRPTTRSLGALRRRHSGAAARHPGRAAHRGTTAAATTIASVRRPMVMRSRATHGRSASKCQGNGQIRPLECHSGCDRSGPSWV
jgi:hypothetical protein